MKVSYCDICNNVIKDADIKFLLGTLQIKTARNSPYDDTYNAEDLQASLLNSTSYNDSTKIYEVCTECYEVLNKLLTIRKADLEAIKNDLNKLWSKNSN